MKTKMTEVKLTAFITTENIYTLEFYPKPLDGEKLVKSDENCIHQIELDLTELPPSIWVSNCESANHGIKQKLGDSLAMTAETKKTATVEDADKIITELFAQLHTSWNATTRANSANTLKVDKSAVNGKLAEMTEEQKEQAIALMKSLGIKF